MSTPIETYEAISGLAGMLTQASSYYEQYMYADSQADLFAGLVPDAQAELLAFEPSLRDAEAALHDVLSADGPADPVAVFAASTALTAVFSEMRVSYERFTGYTAEALNQRAYADQQMQNMRDVLPGIQAAVADAVLVFNPPVE